MIELTRPILLPPHAAGPSGQALEARAGSAGLPVPVVAPVPPAPAQDGRDEPSLSDWRRATPGEADPGERPGGAGDGRGRIAYYGRRGTGGQVGSTAQSSGAAAFMAQQIFQEAMPAGLHLEPWSQGIGAYRRAGAEPPLESADPAVFSLAI